MQRASLKRSSAKDNITISIEYLGSGAVMTEALTAGELEMSFLGGQPAFSGISNGNRRQDYLDGYFFLHRPLSAGCS